MGVSAVMGLGVWVLVIDRSALAITWAVSVELLLEVSGSVVVEDTLAVLEMVAPSGVSERTAARIRTYFVDPAPTAPSDSGEDQAGPVEGSQPEPVQYLAPVSSDGRVSVRDTFWAS